MFVCRYVRIVQPLRRSEVNTNQNVSSVPEYVVSQLYVESIQARNTWSIYAESALYLSGTSICPKVWFYSPLEMSFNIFSKDTSFFVVVGGLLGEAPL